MGLWVSVELHVTAGFFKEKFALGKNYQKLQKSLKNFVINFCLKRS